MEIVGACLLIAAALGLLLRRRRWWAVAIAIALSAAALALVRFKPRARLEPLDNHDAWALCNVVSSQLEDVHGGIIRDRVAGRAPYHISEERLIQWKLASKIAKSALRICTTTEENCAKILDAIDPAASDAAWPMLYVVVAMTRTRRCASELPGDPGTVLEEPIRW